jgi:protein-tyrosine phosphatase
MADGHAGPISGSYWVVPGRLLAGPYPGSWDEAATRERLTQLLEAGVTFVVDLTEPGEHDAYLLLLSTEAAALGRKVTHRRRPIPDMDVPSIDQMTATLDTIDAALADGETVYVHCLGGIGRTGTVIGCYLVRHGLAGQDALDEIVHLRGGLVDSPQTDEQCEMVRTWRSGR